MLIPDMQGSIVSRLGSGTGVTTTLGYSAYGENVGWNVPEPLTGITQGGTTVSSYAFDGQCRRKSRATSGATSLS